MSQVMDSVDGEEFKYLFTLQGAFELAISVFQTLKTYCSTAHKSKMGGTWKLGLSSSGQGFRSKKRWFLGIQSHTEQLSKDFRKLTTEKMDNSND